MAVSHRSANPGLPEINQLMVNPTCYFTMGLARSNSLPKVSTEDDRQRYAGGYSDSGSYSTGAGSGSSRGGAHAQPEPAGGMFGDFDDSGYSSTATTVMTGAHAVEEDEFERPRPGWHGSADFGLLVLRIVLGGIFIGHGLQKLFGLFNGPGIDNFAAFLGQSGFSQTTLLAWVTGISELGGGVLVLLGLFTPLGAAAILGVMANVIFIKIQGGAGFFMVSGVGFEWELGLAGSAFALMFTGPGRVSLDRPTPWYRHPGGFGTVALILAAALTVVTLVVFR